MAKNNHGFSLLEILIALTLIAVITSTVVINFDSVFRTKSEVFSRKAATIVRSARDYALLKKRVVRLRIDLKEQTFWVESGPNSTLLLSQEEEERLKRKLGDEKFAEEQKQRGFRAVKSITDDKQAIPDGVRVTQVLSPRYPDAITNGVIDIYFFPNGFSEASVISLEDYAGTKQSLIINPLTGKIRMEYGDYDPKAENPS